MKYVICFLRWFILISCAVMSLGGVFVSVQLFIAGIYPAASTLAIASMLLGFIAIVMWVEP